MTDNDYIYDIETYPNVFTLAIKHPPSGDRAVFEISDRRNQFADLVAMLHRLKEGKCRMVGFNNLLFDYPVVHYMLRHVHITAADIYAKAHAILTATDRFAHTVWESDHFVQQIDLFKINHFDNIAKSTSLKMLEYNMRMERIQELPFPPGTTLTPGQIDTLIEYGDHDVDATERFYKETLPAIEFRETLSAKYNRNFMNHNDVKIGTDYFIMRLEDAAPGSCYYRDANNKRQKRQTPRDSIVVRNILFPYVSFSRPELQRVHKFFYNETITDTYKAFDKLQATVDGFTFDFGTGGLHGSIDPEVIVSTGTHVIIDVDVTSYYPSLAIANRVYPEHLSEVFCDIYADMKQERISHPKGTPENAMLKLALNGTFGATNSIYSPFYDPAYTMAITINGQLLLAMLAEWVMGIEGLRMIQANTDGITVLCPREKRDVFEMWCNAWEQTTGLELEHADYDRMFIKDVNNYIAEYKGREKYKHKGKYLYERGWHQNQSALVIPKAAEAALVHGVDIETFIHDHKDPFDFMLRTKVPRAGKLLWGDDEVQNISRYYVSKDGAALTKLLKPTAAQIKAKGADAPMRRIGIDVGWDVTVCNDHATIVWDNVNYDYYVAEAKKLVDPLVGN